jgi:hypothetical protein
VGQKELPDYTCEKYALPWREGAHNYCKGEPWGVYAPRSKKKNWTKAEIKAYLATKPKIAPVKKRTMMFVPLSSLTVKFWHVSPLQNRVVRLTKVAMSKRWPAKPKKGLTKVTKVAIAKYWTAKMRTTLTKVEVSKHWPAKPQIAPAEPTIEIVNFPSSNVNLLHVLHPQNRVVRIPTLVWSHKRSVEPEPPRIDITSPKDCLIRPGLAPDTLIGLDSYKKLWYVRNYLWIESRREKKWYLW